MASPGDRTIIKAEIERLQKAQLECTDSGIRGKIDAWIVEEKKKLASGEYSPCSICCKACPPEDSVTTAQGLLMHKSCYRSSKISSHY
jgi:hypothetical protein